MAAKTGSNGMALSQAIRTATILYEEGAISERQFKTILTLVTKTHMRRSIKQQFNINLRGRFARTFAFLTSSLRRDEEKRHAAKISANSSEWIWDYGTRQGR
jgi:hypothetical protein